MARDFSELGADVFDDTLPPGKKHKLSQKTRNYILGLSITGAAVIALVTGAAVYANTTLWNFSYLEALEFTYVENDTGVKEAVINKLNREKNYPVNFRIPTEIKGHKIVGIADSAFSGCSNLKSVSMTNNIRSIGDRAFEGCANLSKIKFSKKLTHLGNYAFLGTEYERNLPEDSCTIINGSFLIHVGQNAFSANTVLLENEDAKNDFISSSYYDSSVTYNYAYFSELDGDGSSCNIVSFMNGLFEDNDKIAYVQIPSSLTYLPAECFKGATNLKTVDISKTNISSLSDAVFKDCTSLSNIVINSELKLTEVGAYCFANTGVGNDDIPSLSDLEKLGEGAFQNCDGLTSIKYPDNLTTIPDYLFDGCSSLSSFVFEDENGGDNGTGEKVDYIGVGAFRGTAISSFRVPYLVSTLQDYTFAECSNLESVTVFNNTQDTMIPGTDGPIQDTDEDGNPLFDENGDPVYLYETDDNGDPIMNGDDYIYIYNYSTSVKDGNYNREAENPGKLAGLTAIRSYAFYQDSNFKTLNTYDEAGISDITAPVSGEEGKVNLPRTITTMNGIMDGGDYGCIFEGTAIKKVSIPYYAKNLGAATYRNATSLEYVEFEKGEKLNPETGEPTGVFECSVRSIGASCFESSGLKEIEVPNSVTSIGKDSFKNCTSLTKVSLPTNASFNTVLNGTFEDCTNLTDFTLPSQVTVIYNNAFKGVQSVTEFVIPAKISRIYAGAFTNMLHSDGTKTKVKLEMSEAEYNANSGFVSGWCDNTVELSFAA